LITKIRIIKSNCYLAVGPEYLALGLTALVSAFSGGTWAANKILNRSQERVGQLHKLIESQEKRVDSLEEQIYRMPLDYVLKVDFLREIQDMHENFRQINTKLDKLMEKLFTK
jgi:TolA-binding protein